MTRPRLKSQRVTLELPSGISVQHDKPTGTLSSVIEDFDKNREKDSNMKGNLEYFYKVFKETNVQVLIESKWYDIDEELVNNEICIEEVQSIHNSIIESMFGKKK